MIEAAEKMEELQERYPTISLAGITDLSKVKAYIESLDLFAEPYAAEIKDLTKLTWMSTADGAYALQIPESQDITGQYARYQHERLVISQNELGEYELWIHSTQTEKQLGIYNSLQEALQSGDEVVTRCRPSRMKLLQREASWHAQPASDPAKKLLRSLSKKLPILRCLCPGSQRAILCPTCRLATGITAGEASTAINLLKSRRKG
jgi:hypothetical protein